MKWTYERFRKRYEASDGFGTWVVTYSPTSKRWYLARERFMSYEIVSDYASKKKAQAAAEGIVQRSG